MPTYPDHPSQARATALKALQELEDLQAERDALRAFAQDCFAEWPEQETLDEFQILVMAEEHGLMEKVEASEPCGEGCACAEYGDFPMTCYRRTALLTGEEG